MPDFVADLLGYIDLSPTPYHAVAESVRRLEQKGYRRLSETEIWRLEPGSRQYVVRNDGSLVAFEVGTESPAEAGFRMIGAHTDSPNLRLKPLPDRSSQGYRQLAVEPYGGVLLHTWLDRDLSLAGRVTVQSRAGVETLLLDFGRPLLRIPNLAIHLQREIANDGLKLNAQEHLARSSDSTRRPTCATSWPSSCAPRASRSSRPRRSWPST
jgi:aspartyl aminopeptidase